MNIKQKTIYANSITSGITALSLIAAIMLISAGCGRMKKMPDIQGAIITEYRGTVTVQKNGSELYTISPEDINTEKAIIADGAILSTEKNSRADLQFTTGISMRVGPETQIKVEKTQVLTGENFSRVLLYLKKGGLYTKVPKQSNSSTVAITTPTAAAMVRGTEFYIEESEGRNKVSVIEGAVLVRPSAKGAEEKLLEQNKKSEIAGSKMVPSDISEGELQTIREKGSGISEISDSAKSQFSEIFKNSEEQNRLYRETLEYYQNIGNIKPENITEKAESDPAIKAKEKPAETQRIRDEEEFGRLKTEKTETESTKSSDDK